MPVDRFEGSFHQSNFKQYLGCPRAFYYGLVLNLDREKVSISNLAGRALHDTFEHAHRHAHRENVWDFYELWEFFQSQFLGEKYRAMDDGLELVGNADDCRYQKMLKGYIEKPYNRHAKVIALEMPFTCKIKPSATEYTLEGRIDQLLLIHRDLLRDDFPKIYKWAVMHGHDEVLIHRDTKTGRRKGVSEFELALNVQFDVYSLALNQGLFHGKPAMDIGVYNEVNDTWFPDLVPHFHALYFTEDHIPYESDAGAYLKPKDGDPVNKHGRVSCDIVDTPCLVGKTQKPCEGKRTYCTKQVRGQGMYFTRRPEARLKEIPKELGRICASIRMGHYPRSQGDLCFNYCAFRTTCEQEVLAEVEAA